MVRPLPRTGRCAGARIDDADGLRAAIHGGPMANRRRMNFPCMRSSDTDTSVCVTGNYQTCAVQEVRSAPRCLWVRDNGTDFLMNQVRTGEIFQVLDIFFPS